MYDKQPVKLDPALEALITLQQRAAPTTPTGQPTVASQLMNAVSGSMGAAQPQGIASVIQGAREAAPSVAQNAQQGQLDQMAQQVAQRMQQQQQPQGITGLPVGSMGFKEGGIVPSEQRFAKGGSPLIDLSGAFKAQEPIEQLLGVGLPQPATPDPNMAAMNAAITKRQDLENTRPDYLGQTLAAMEEAKRARQEALATQRKNEGFDRLMAMFSGGARAGALGMGEGVTAFNKGVEARDNAARELDAVDAQMRIKAGEAEHARKIGDVDKLINIRKEMGELQNHKDKVAADIMGHGVQREGIVSRERTSAAENASREKIAREHNAVLLKGYEVRDTTADQKQRFAAFKFAVEKPGGVAERVKQVLARRYSNSAEKDKALQDISAEVKQIAEAFGVPHSEAYATIGVPASSGGTGVSLPQNVTVKRVGD